MKIMMTIREFTQKCREQQGKYRERMGEPMGVPLAARLAPQVVLTSPLQYSIRSRVS